MEKSLRGNKFLLKRIRFIMTFSSYNKKKKKRANEKRISINTAIARFDTAFLFRL